jgi:hypothetical protein
MLNLYIKVNYRFSIDETSWSPAEYIKTTLPTEPASHLGAIQQDILYMRACARASACVCVCLYKYIYFVHPLVTAKQKGLWLM